MFYLQKWHFLSTKHSKNNPNRSEFKASHICLLPSLHFRKPKILMPGEPRELLYFIFFFGCIYNTWKYSNEARRFLGNLCFPSATGSSQGSPRLTPPQAGVQSLPPFCLWNAIPHLLLCSASYSFFCVMFCEMSSPQRAADEIYLFISTLQTCPQKWL